MKKFLSLVLALTMALSLVTVSAGATSFEDDGDITYQEAVTVIAGLGIVEGYDDGSFNPTGGLTRGAAAKIICNLILGPTTADALNATSAPFSDVPTTNEFAGYIAYCSQQGIISGYADGTFRPSASLTGYAFMKMLLGALGYNSTYEGYTGSNWSIQVAKQAIGIGLDDGNDDFNGTDNVTREEACLYAFNTLQATLVEYSSSNTIIVGDVEVTTASDRSEVENNDSDETIEDDDLMQFAEEYFEDLVAEDDTDGFGRPATTWVYDGDELGTYANDADDLYVLDDEYTLQTLLTDGDCLNYSSSDVLSDAVVYFNGNEEGEYSDLRNENLGSKGDILEVFEDDSGDVESIIFRSYTYALVDEVDSDLSSTHTNRGATVGIELVGIDGSSIGTYYDDYNDDDDILQGYSGSYTEGTVLAVALSDGDSGAVLDSYAMESVTGTPTAGRTVATETNSRNDTVVTTGTITIDGTRYTYAGQMTGLSAGDNVSFDDEYTIYLTAEGYVLAVDGDASAALDDIYYVAGVYGERSAGRTTHYIETVSLTDGTYAVLELSSDGWDQFEDLSTVTSQAGYSEYEYDSSVGGLYVLDEDDDEYEIASISISSSSPSGGTDLDSDDDTYTGRLRDSELIGNYTVAISMCTAVDSGLSQPVESDSTTIRFSNSDTSRVYLTDTTFFVSVEGNTGDGDSLDVSTATGVMTVDDEDSESLSVFAVYDDDQDALYVMYTAASLAGAVNLNDVVYLTDDATTENSDGYEADLYLLGDMELAEDVTIDNNDTQGFYTYEINEDSIYELSDADNYELDVDEIDDEDGFSTGVVFDAVRSNRADGKSDNGTDYISVSFANAVVIDTRSSSDKNKDAYSSDIESASALSSAINRTDDIGGVTADVFVEDGEIVFVAVTAVANADDDDSLSVDASTGVEFSVNRNGSYSDTLTGLEEGERVYVRAKDGYAIDVDGTTDVDLEESTTSGTYYFYIEDDVEAGAIEVTRSLAVTDIEITGGEGSITVTWDYDGTATSSDEVTVSLYQRDASGIDVRTDRNTSLTGTDTSVTFNEKASGDSGNYRAIITVNGTEYESEYVPVTVTDAT